MKSNLKTIKNLFYPGCGVDFDVFKYFAETSSVRDFYYCDYLNRDFTVDVILQEFNNQMGLQGYTIEYYADFTPRSFNQPNWNSFWHIDAKKNMAPGEPADAFISIFKIKKNKKTWNLYYFGTEAFQTYEILLQNTIKMDVVVTQDHGLGCFWDTFCKYSRLEKTARHLNLMPDYLLVGLNDEPWDYYLQTKKPFGAFGSWQHQRKLFKRTSYYEDNM